MRGTKALYYTVGILVCVVMLFPLFWMISLSFMTEAETWSLPIKLLPHHPTIEHYRNLGTYDNFPYLKFLLNTVIVAGLGGFGTALGSSMPAYAFSKLQWKGRDFFLLVTIATLMLPEISYIVPRYIIFTKLHLIGTFAPMWLPSALGTAFNVFLFTQFFKGIPKELSEAAIVDGSNHFSIFFRIILPLSKNAMVTVVTLHFVWAWKELMTPLIYFTDANMFTLSVGLKNLVSTNGGGDLPVGIGMVGASLATLPILLLFFIFQRQITGGIATTGTKG
jgi:ABC-type glycerol-3-phosphate transport system permease component